MKCVHLGAGNQDQHPSRAVLGTTGTNGTPTRQLRDYGNSYGPIRSIFGRGWRNGIKQVVTNGSSRLAKRKWTANLASYSTSKQPFKDTDDGFFQPRR